MPQPATQVDLIRLLLARLERVSADSTWAHRASGIRGALLKSLEAVETGGKIDRKKTRQLITFGFRLLESAAREK